MISSNTSDQHIIVPISQSPPPPLISRSRWRSPLRSRSGSPQLSGQRWLSLSESRSRWRSRSRSLSRLAPRSPPQVASQAPSEAPQGSSLIQQQSSHTRQPSQESWGITWQGQQPSLTKQPSQVAFEPPSVSGSRAHSRRPSRALSGQQPNLPLSDLIDGSRENYINIGVPLYEASTRGDWKAAKAIIDKQPKLIRSAITENYETPLHIAASENNTKHAEQFVKNLVNMMEKEDLQLQNQDYQTALCLAAAAGNVKMVEIMVKKSNVLLEIRGSEGMMPLYMAALFGKHDTVRFLYDNSSKMTGNLWTDKNRGGVLQKCVEADIFDVAVQIVSDHPELAISRSVLGVLARKRDAFSYEDKPKGMVKTFGGHGPAEKQHQQALQLLRIIWKKILLLPQDEIDDIVSGPMTSEEEAQDGNRKYSSPVLFVAAEMGNTGFLVEILRQSPYLARYGNHIGQTIFHIAISNRHAGIYNLLYEMRSTRDLIVGFIDDNGNNMLHLVGKSAESDQVENVPEVGLQFQLKLLWFKEIEKIVPPSYRERKNKKGLTPRQLFNKNHKKLVSKVEEWTKETAQQLMVVAALIATIAFTAAFTFAGGYNQNTGHPIFLRKGLFQVFLILDGLSFISSSVSILMILSILISHRAETDFMESLPKQLTTSLKALFFSVLTMILAFVINFFLLYENTSKWLPGVMTLFAIIPCFIFSKHLYPLLRYMFTSMEDSMDHFGDKGRMFTRKTWEL